MSPAIPGRMFLRRWVQPCLAVAALLLLPALAAPGFAAADPTPPTVAITSPAGGSALQGAVTVRGTASSTNISRLVILVEVQLDSGAWKTAQGTTTWTYRLDTAPLDDGWHTLRARSWDGREHSQAAGIEFETRNAQSAGMYSGALTCIVLIVVLVTVLAAVVVLVRRKPVQVENSQYAVPAPPVQAGPPPLWYMDQRGRRAPYPFPGSPFYQPPPASAPYPMAAPPRPYSPGGLQAQEEAITVLPMEGGPLPSPGVVEHEAGAAPAAGGLEIDEAMYPDSEAGRITVAEVLDMPEETPAGAVEAIDMEPPPEPTEQWPPAPPGAAGFASAGMAGDRHSRVRRALAAMPRGIPMPLLGISMDELSGMILAAKPQEAPGGSPVVRLKGRWYRADENNLKDFMVEYKP